MQLFFLAILTLVHGHCPEIYEIPITFIDENDRYTCARVYPGNGNDLGVNGCNNCTDNHAWDVPAGADYPGEYSLKLDSF